MQTNKFNKLLFGGNNIKIVNQTINLITFISLFFTSCSGNEFYLNKENYMIYSKHNLRNIDVETNKDSYLIICKEDYIGDKYIKLDSITDNYYISINGLPIKIDQHERNKKFNIMFENGNYVITNFSNGDAGPYELSFSTDSIGKIHMNSK